MATQIFRGDAQAIAKVCTVTIGGTAANGQVYSVKMNNSLKVISYTADADDTNSDIASALKALLAASTVPEFTEVVWTVNSAVITATARTAGKDFTISSVSATGTGTAVLATTTSSTGPNHWDDPDNWSQGHIPQGACSAPVQADTVAVSGGSLSNGTTYYYVVTATNANGETVVSNEKSYAASTPNLTATISWAQVTGATGYKIYRNTSAGVYTNKLLTTISSGSTLSYNDTGTAVGAGTPPGSTTATGDDVYLTKSAVSLLYGLNQSNWLYNSLNIDASYTGKLGNPVVNTTGSGYYEYRDRFLIAAATTINISLDEGGGSGRINLDLGSSTCAINIYGTGTPAETGVPSVNIKGGTNTLMMKQGSAGFAEEDGTTSTISTVYTGYKNSKTTDVQLVLGSGCTLTTINQYGGQITARSNITTLTLGAGSFILTGSATLTTLSAIDGLMDYQSTGTLTTANLEAKGILDFSKVVRARTVTNCTMHAGAKLYDGGKTVTFSNGIILDGCGLEDVTLDLGKEITISRT